MLREATLAAVIVCTACGPNAASGNAGKVHEARSVDAQIADVRGTLRSKLSTYTEAGVTDTFRVDSGLCDIDDVVAADATLARDPMVLISPDKKIAVKVGTFIGVRKADCLSMVLRELGWK